MLLKKRPTKTNRAKGEKSLGRGRLYVSSFLIVGYQLSISLKKPKRKGVTPHSGEQVKKRTGRKSSINDSLVKPHKIYHETQPRAGLNASVDSSFLASFTPFTSVTISSSSVK